MNSVVIFDFQVIEKILLKPQETWLPAVWLALMFSAFRFLFRVLTDLENKAESGEPAGFGSHWLNY